MQTPANQKSPPPILPGIQLLRGLAALLVVAAHANLMMGNPKNFGVSPFPLHDAGVFGVTVFFVISGFIIVNVSLDRNWEPRLSIPDYARRRFMRIVPFLWVSVIVYNVLSYVGTRQVEWLPALRAMTLWPIGELKPNVVWSLQHEMFFYILFAVAMLGARRRMAVLIAWFVAPIVYGAYLAFGGPQPPWPWLAELLRVLLLGGFSGANVQFGTGFALGLLWLRRPAISSLVLPHGLLISLIVLLLATALVEAVAFPIAGFGRIVGWSLLALIIVAVGVTARENRGVLFRAGMVLGNASFSIYLVHNAAVLILFKAAMTRPGLMPLPLWFLVFLISATGLGIAVHYLVEAPLINRLAHGRALFPWQRPTI